MHPTVRPSTSRVSTTLLLGAALSVLPAAAHAQDGGGPRDPQVTLEVAPAKQGGDHSWKVTFAGEHLEPKGDSPRIEWAVDTWAPATGTWPVTVAEGSTADPQCSAGAPSSSHDVVSPDRKDLGATEIPAGTDRVMVYGAYCATDGSVHRFEQESYLTQQPDGTITVESYPLEDVPVDGDDEPAPQPEPEPEPTPEPGPIIDTGWAGNAGSTAVATGVAGLAMVTAGGVLTTRGRRSTL
ncbi:hypothetical protein [Kytococcus sp. Marseille-QA3725]